MSTPQPPPSSTPPHQDQEQSQSQPQPQPQHQPQPQQVQSSTPGVKKISPTPWSHLETVRLIETYQEKWYSLKRGQLKANQWEEVAVTVAARCGYDEPSKTATQCRHKMEKLRKRYRSERQRCASNASAWPYFHLMDYMERGPMPIAARPMASVADRGRVVLGRSMKEEEDDDGDDDDDDDDEDEEDSEGKERSKSRSIHHILRKHPAVEPVWFRKKPSLSPPPPPLRRQWNNGGSGGGGGMVVGPPGVSRFMRDDLGYLKRRRPSEEDEEEEEEVEEEEEEEGSGGGEEVLSELAAVVRTFGEGFVRMENLKMEMMKETERYRMEMETKRTEMIMESQNRIVEMIAKALGSQQRKQKKTHET
ncbi:hypothetical protein Sjap_021940 [Stephania japonica]|uniref:Myb-like domain-containing protein n=1 Tax=Stephania japonica TaxID=461633 RepID=A0AAP0EV47_9MAGN